jgi:hypothetical protein
VETVKELLEEEGGGEGEARWRKALSAVESIGGGGEKRSVWKFSWSVFI